MVRPLSEPFTERIAETIEQLAPSETVRLYGIGSNAKSLQSDLDGVLGIAKILGKLNDIVFADVPKQSTHFIPQPMAWDKQTRSRRPDPSRPDRWEMSVDSDAITNGLSLQSLPFQKPDAVPHPAKEYGSQRLSSGSSSRLESEASRAINSIHENSTSSNSGSVPQPEAQRNYPDNLNKPPEQQQDYAPPERDIDRIAAETASTVADVSSGGGGGNRIPPVDPPVDPPDEDPHDENELFRRFTEWLQRFTGVMPEAREFDTLLNNVTDVLGGQPAQPNDPTRPSPLAGFMTAFSDYFNTPQLSPEAQIRSEQDLTEAVEELTRAVTGNTRTRSGTTPRANRVTNWIRRRAQRAVVGTAKVMARMARPFARGVNRLIPQNMRAQMTRFGAQIIGQQAQRLGVPAATAARFGASLGPAAALVGVGMIAVPIVGAIVGILSKWSVEALATLNRVAKYSPQLTTAQMGLDTARLQREMDTARRSGQVGATRIDMQNREEAAWTNWEQFKTDSGNLYGTASSGLSSLTGEVVNQSMAAIPRIVELLGNLTNLESIEKFGRTAVDYWTKSAQEGVDPYRGSSFGMWMNNQANGAEAQDQVRRARKPLGPLQ